MEKIKNKVQEIVYAHKELKITMRIQNPLSGCVHTKHNELLRKQRFGIKNIWYRSYMLKELGEKREQYGMSGPKGPLMSIEGGGEKD